MSGTYPLPAGDLRSLGFASKPLDHLDGLIRSHIDEGRYPGAQIALARHGKLALFRTYGNAKTEGGKVPATNETLRVFEEHSAAEVEQRVAAAWDRFQSYRWTSFRQRAGYLI